MEVPTIPMRWVRALVQVLTSVQGIVEARISICSLVHREGEADIFSLRSHH